MPRNPSITLPAPSGMDNTNDPLVTPLNIGQQVVNFAADREGVLRGTPKFISLVSASPTAVQIDGVAYYYGQSTFTGVFDVFNRAVTQKQPDAAGDRVLAISNGRLFSFAYNNLFAGPAYGTPFAPAYPPSIGSKQTVTASQVFATGQPLRSAQFATELILVQKGANSNYRYYINSNTFSGTVPAGVVYTQGLETPAAPTIAYNAPGVGYVAKVGTIYYAIALIDEFGRYSSPGATVTGDYVTNAGTDGTLTFTVSAGMNTRFVQQGITQIAFLGTIQGVPGSYYVLQAPITGAPAIQTYTGAGAYVFVDGVPDTTVASGISGPTIGQNDAPFASSLCILWKNRMVQNNLYDPNQLQISNNGSPTQFNTAAYDPNNPVPTNGLTMQVDQDNGNEITSLQSFGTILAIFKRRSIFLLYGEDASNFVIQPVYYGHGAEAPDSAQRCEGFVVYLSDDGVYQWAGGEPVKISGPIDSMLESYNLTQTGAAIYTAAKAAYNDSQYMLWIGPDCYVYNFDNKGWTMRAFGPDADAFLSEMNWTGVSPFDPRSYVPNPSSPPNTPDPTITIPNAGPNTPPNGSPPAPSGPTTNPVIPPGPIMP